MWKKTNASNVNGNRHGTCFCKNRITHFLKEVLTHKQTREKQEKQKEKKKSKTH